jgi:hypothetical protein
MKSLSSAAIVMTIIACSTGNETMSVRTKVSSEEAMRQDDVDIDASVFSSQEELGLLGAASITDFEMGIKCAYGSANTVVERSFKKAQFDSKAAKLPKAAKNCSSHLKSLSIAVPTAPAKNWSLKAPANTSGASFNNNTVLTYTYTKPANPGANEADTSATAKLKRTQEFPPSIDGDSTKNKVEFAFVVSTENASTANTYTVNAQTVDSNATVSGITPPLYNVSIKSAAANGNSCSLVIKAVCARPTTVNNQIDACNDVKRTKTLVTVEGTTIAAGNITFDSATPGTSLNFPYTISNCDPGATGTFTKTLQIQFVDATDAAAANKSTLTAPITLTLTFNPN